MVNTVVIDEQPYQFLGFFPIQSFLYIQLLDMLSNVNESPEEEPHAFGKEQIQSKAVMCKEKDRIRVN